MKARFKPDSNFCFKELFPMVEIKQFGCHECTIKCSHVHQISQIKNEELTKVWKYNIKE